MFSVSAYDYELPDELIATRPVSPRDSSRLMVVERQSGKISLHTFSDLKNLLTKDHHLVFNDTKVIEARLFGKKKSGATIEILLLKHLFDNAWEALVRPLKKVKENEPIEIGRNFSCTLEKKLSEGKVILRFSYDGIFEERLKEHGQIPLPHYIRREPDPTIDPESYQTVYAASPGAIAAPTAGLHFTNDLLNVLKDKGVESTRLTLHVGLGTFRPVQTEDIRQHPMHAERVMITDETANSLNNSQKRRISVGTTTCRALESAAQSDGTIQAGDFETSIFIYPGYQFRATEALLTNFHLPRSTLLMLVSAFGGYELIREAYRLAVKERFRFFSYGDAMLIL